jgi:4'-phosphopantetheinyl transferase
VKPGADEVHVWLAYDREFADESVLRSFADMLEPAERERHGRLRAEHLPRQYLVTRALQRAVLSRCEPAIAPAQWRFATGEHGKPRVAREFESLGLHFNLAHTSGLVVMAVARRELGVDTEELSRRLPAPGVIEQYLAPRERAGLAALDDARRASRFYAIWSLKEAWIKATGEGLGAELRAVSFEPDAHAFSMSGDDARRWGFWQGTPSPGHVVSLAMPGAAAEVAVRVFQRGTGAALEGEPVAGLRRLSPDSGQEQRAQT